MAFKQSHVLTRILIGEGSSVAKINEVERQVDDFLSTADIVDLKKARWDANWKNGKYFRIPIPFVLNEPEIKLLKARYLEAGWPYVKVFEGRDHPSGPDGIIVHLFDHYPFEN